jgi:hypothetical protein
LARQRQLLRVAFFLTALVLPESFLANLYIDRRAREKFLADSRSNASKAGMARDASDSLEKWMLPAWNS